MYSTNLEPQNILWFQNWAKYPILHFKPVFEPFFWLENWVFRSTDRNPNFVGFRKPWLPKILWVAESCGQPQKMGKRYKLSLSRHTTVMPVDTTSCISSIPSPPKKRYVCVCFGACSVMRVCCACVLFLFYFIYLFLFYLFLSFKYLLLLLGISSHFFSPSK